MVSDAQTGDFGNLVSKGIIDKIGFVLEFAVGMQFPTLTIVSVA
jgi:hypothetical protein